MVDGACLADGWSAWRFALQARGPGTRRLRQLTLLQPYVFCSVHDLTHARFLKLSVRGSRGRQPPDNFPASYREKCGCRVSPTTSRSSTPRDHACSCHDDVSRLVTSRMVFRAQGESPAPRSRQTRAARQRQSCNALAAKPRNVGNDTNTLTTHKYRALSLTGRALFRHLDAGAPGCTT